jgi:nucleotidyltransferase/DNA polymerase involved in DNA repair
MTSGNGNEAHDATSAGAVREHKSVLQIEFVMGYSPLMGKANIKRNTKDLRELRALISIGPAMVRDFKLLGVDSVANLARQNPERLYKKLCRVTGQQQDICVLDTFRAGVAQARDPRLPAEQCQWWYWSRRRKASNRR